MHQMMLCAAIRERKIVRLKLHDDSFPILFEPHILYTSREGAKLVSGRNRGSQLNSFFTPGWMTLTVDGISTLDMTGTTFQPIPGFGPSEERYGGSIICNVLQDVD